MNLIIILCLSLLTIGCNRKLEAPKLVSIDPTFQSLVNDFVTEGRSQGVNIVIDNLSVHFTTSLVAETLGECMMFNHGQDGTPMILINKQDWATETATTRKIVMFHEMGHCVLWREHNNNWNGGIATSIMYPYIEWDSMYLNNWNYYMQELFYGF